MVGNKHDIVRELVFDSIWDHEDEVIHHISRKYVHRHVDFQFEYMWVLHAESDQLKKICIYICV
jgi:hypothetical protein